MIKWSDIHVGVGAFGTIYLGKSRPSKEYDGLTVWTDRSGDMTDECLVAVRDHLEARIQKGKKYNRICLETERRKKPRNFG